MVDTVESWIDEVARVWGSIQTQGGQKLTSYRVFEKAEYPEALSEYPCVLTYTREVRPTYSAGGVNVSLWRGTSEFHLTPNTQKQHYPLVMGYFSKILVAAAANLTLNGKVALFHIENQEGAGIQGPVTLRYGDEPEHLGLVVNWRVKELVSGLVVA